MINRFHGSIISDHNDQHMRISGHNDQHSFISDHNDCAYVGAALADTACKLLFLFCHALETGIEDCLGLVRDLAAPSPPNTLSARSKRAQICCLALGAHGKQFSTKLGTQCRYKDLAAINAEVGQAALALYCATVRATLFVCKGYECQEKEGVFMTAFPGPIKALEWAVTLQMALLRCDMLLVPPRQPTWEALCACLLVP